MKPSRYWIYTASNGYGCSLVRARRSARGQRRRRARRVRPADSSAGNRRPTQSARGGLDLDFGIAKLTEPGEEETEKTRSAVGGSTEEGHIVGAVAYMSPEQAQGLKIDPRSDIFSLGAVLYEMVTGRAAFAGGTKLSTLAAILDRDAPPLTATTPRDLDRIITRCLRKDPARRFQTMADLRVALDELKQESDSGRLVSAPVNPSDGRSRRMLIVASGVVATGFVLAGLGAVWWLRTETPGTATVSASNLRQLTFDSGESSAPSLSPDAKLVAYQSDRDGVGRFDIWVQQTSGGSPIRLTTGAGDHRRPVFSGDGSKIYFDSTGPPPGIYEIPALGGEPRLVAANGIWAQVSQDGRHLAFTSPSTSEAFIVSLPGREPRRITEGFSLIGVRPVWLRDSKRIALFLQKTGQQDTREWWAIPIDGTAGQPLNWVRWAGTRGYFGQTNVLLPNMHIATLSRRPGENQQICAARFSGDLVPYDVNLEPLTSGASWSSNATVAAGKIAFQSGTPEIGLWTLPANTAAGRVTGKLERLSSDQPGNIRMPFWSPDGRMLYYETLAGGSSFLAGRSVGSDGRPSGPNQRVHEFVGRVRPSAGGGPAPAQSLVATSDRFIGVFADFKYNIWMMDLPEVGARTN